MTPAAWNVLATVGMFAFFLISIVLTVGWIRSERENLVLRRENAEVAECRAREDAHRIDVLRQALDSANRKNRHFVEWSAEEPVDPTRPGGEPS